MRVNRRGDVDIREATTADVAALFQVRIAVTENAMTMTELAEVGITPAAIIEMVETKSAGTWVAVDGGSVVAFSMSKRESREVFALFVLPSHEGQGLGSALLATALDWLQRYGKTPITLTTYAGSRAHRFYLKRGWVEKGWRDEEIELQFTP